MNKPLKSASGWLLLAWLLLPGLAVAQDAGLKADAAAVIAPAVEPVAAPAVAPKVEVAPPKATVKVPEHVDVPWEGRLVSLLGLVALMLGAWGLSANRKLIPWRIIGWGVGIQLVLGLVLLRTGFGRSFFESIGRGVEALMGFYTEGANLIFGRLMADSPVPFALSVLPTIIFFSALMAVLYHLRIMQFVVGGVAWVMRFTLKTSGAESLSAAGNIFVGQTEAPLLVRPFVERMTRSELMSVMVGGFATVAGGVMVAYVTMLKDTFPGIAGHLLVASILSAPASLVIAKLMLPEEEKPVTAGVDARAEASPYTNLIDAAATGAADGLKLALNVAAMLLAFVGLVALLNALVGFIGGLVGYPQASVQLLLGYALAPVAWIMGVPWEDAPVVGSLLGVKTVLNEFYAYANLGQLLAGSGQLQPRSVVIATYALCGFANFGSIAIQVGGIGALAPSRRADLAKLGLKAMIGGTLAAFMTATVAGLVL